MSQDTPTPDGVAPKEKEDIYDHQGLLTQKITDEILLRSMKAGGRKPAKYANGRRAVLEMLDVLMAREKNIHKVAAAMQERIDVDAVGFVKEIIMPLMPKSMIEGREDLDTSKDGQGTVVVLPDNGRPLTPVTPDADPDTDRDQSSRPDSDRA